MRSRSMASNVMPGDVRDSVFGASTAKFGRQVGKLDQSTAAQDERAFDDVFQFTDIAWVVMLHEACEHFDPRLPPRPCPATD